ncbi:thiamine diphosphokinase [Anoxynatronum buryatiense]|uniref:Thiamine diphosphokinase n=1 Tax=Anoxynatronum buryatiense TaxID=489973 RepID=A0AA45WUJ6_9CLOT|nr:thiamine diphosphokinase [Anoxynatronum buryatiense]SMP46918.1 thiamine diphosphokinase [Anoxynatronum buryatiense]
MRILVVTNGDVDDLAYLEEQANVHDMIICVDGAVRHLRPIGITPSILAGDLDSISAEDLQWVEEHHIPLLRYETRKDYTDTELALLHAIEKGARHVTMTGAIGSRIDHTLGNIFLLKLLWNRQVEGTIESETVEMRIIGKEVNPSWRSGETVSFIPISNMVTGLTLLGFEYPLNRATIHLGSSRCISNVIASDCPVIRVEKGLLLAIRNKRKEQSLG